MELRDIKKIVEMISEHELTEFELQDDDFRLAIKRGAPAAGQPMLIQAPVPAYPPAAAPSDQPAMEVVAPEEEDEDF